ncbi:MAG: hypothetical protein HOV79_19805 [Hamadaea sp.]|nr:hypothetical protein [Hamadaea sp.]
MTVAVLGAAGAVGRLVIEALEDLGLGPVRSGTRVTVDAADPAAVARFADGAAVLVNCLGPAFRLRGRVVAAADRTGCAYVDPSGDDALHARLSGERVGVPVVTGVGSVPGALGLLARWLADGRPPGGRLRGHVLTDEPIHPGTALEFLLGARVGQDAGAPTTIRLPVVPQPLLAYAFTSRETADLVADLRPDDAAFYHCFAEDGAALRTVRRLAGLSLREAAAEFAAAVNADLEGRLPTHAVVVTAGERTAVLRADSSYRVTANMVALAVGELIGGTVPAGVARADVLDPSIVTRLPRLPGGVTLTVSPRDHGLCADLGPRSAQ